jgi:hypothetical protein
MKTSLSRVLNLALWLVGGLLAATGLVLAFRVPPGSRGGHGLSLLGWTRHDWGDLHAWLAYGVIALVLGHLALHARWLWIVASRRRPARLVAGLALGLALPAAALLWPTEQRAGSAQHERAAWRDAGAGARKP